MCFLILQLDKLNREYTGYLPLHLVLMGFHLARARSCVLEEARRGTDEAVGANFIDVYNSIRVLFYNVFSDPEIRTTRMNTRCKK